MRLVAVLLLLITFLGIGSGAWQHLHNQTHAAEDAAAIAAAQRDGQPLPVVPVHSDANCFIHAQLHASAIFVGWVTLLICLGLFVAFLTEIARPLVSQRPIFRFDCRGPPVCLCNSLV